MQRIEELLSELRSHSGTVKLKVLRRRTINVRNTQREEMNFSTTLKNIRTLPLVVALTNSTGHMTPETDDFNA